MTHARPLPQTDSWVPRDASTTLASVLAQEVAGVEKRLLQGLSHEKRLAINNFDSGIPFQQLVCNEIARLLPRRYSVTSGVLIDRFGKTAGNCDLVLFNDFWFSAVKPSLIGISNPSYLPIEGVFAVGEIKQSLSSTTLDDAMAKLVMCHRLSRPRTCADRIVENREASSCPHGLTNPLFSFILAGGIADGEKFTDLVNRFYDISKTLGRLELVRVLCVLQEGTVTWAFIDPSNHREIKPARFMRDDLFHPIFPILSPASKRSPLLQLLQSLHQGLFDVVLGPEDISVAYSVDDNGIKIPTDRSIALPPDQE